MPSASRHTRNRRGSVLFMILLAVVLFGALYVAVTGSDRGGTKDASSENADAAAAEILQWFAAVDNAVMRMKMNGIAYEDMSFGYEAKRFDGTPSPNYINNTRCTSDTCRIFKSSGGGVRPPDFSKYGNPNAADAAGTNPGAGYMAIATMQWPGAGSSLNDIVLWLYWMRQDVCQALNRKIGISNIPTYTGPWSVAYLPTSWDDPSRIFTSNEKPLYSLDSVALGINSPNTQGAYCYIIHVVIKR